MPLEALPLVGYLGSKAASGVSQAIIALMPPHETFIDLYAGSGAILLRKPPSVRSYAVDLDPNAPALKLELPQLQTAMVDARSFLDTFDWARAGRVLIYADPPYLHSTRTSKARYRFEMTDADHLALLAQLRAVPAEVIISGYPAALYDANLPGWNSKEFQAMTRGGVRTEKLWYNFEPVAFYSTRYAGKDFTDRQRIKRKAERWARNYGALPPSERLAILTAILAWDTDESDYDAGRIDGSSSVGRHRQTRATMHDRFDFALSTLPDSGATKLSPRESAELGGR